MQSTRKHKIEKEIEAIRIKVSCSAVFFVICTLELDASSKFIDIPDFFQEFVQ